MSEQGKKGGCHCGAVRYEVRGEVLPVIYCHCRQCRVTTGHLGAFARAEKAETEISDPQGALRWYHASDQARRGFCSSCGSTLFWEPTGKTTISMAAGSFDEPNELGAQAHIYTRFQGSYYGLSDDLPYYSEDFDSERMK